MVPEACDHQEISSSEITVGDLRAGRVRVLIAVPAGADLGIYTLELRLADWLKRSGGFGPDLYWETKPELVDIDGPRPRPGCGAGGRGNGGPQPRNRVALVWNAHEEHDGWNPANVGEVELVMVRRGWSS